MAQQIMAPTNPVDMSQYIQAMTNLGNANVGTSNTNLDAARARTKVLQDRADAVSDTALDTSAKFNQYSDTDRGLYEGTYVPAMKQQMDFAQGYTTPERMAANRGAAAAQANIATDANVAAAERALQGNNIDPSSGAFAGLKENVALNRAKTAAGMMQASDRNTEMLGQQYLDNAIKTGAVLPGQSQNDAGTALALANQGINTGLATEQQRNVSEGNPTQWAALGADSMKEWGKGLVSQTSLGLQSNRDTAQENLAEQKMQDTQSQRSSGIGAAIGTVAGAGLGFWAGGPAGAMAGASMGGTAGGKLSAKGGMIRGYAEGGEIEPDDLGEGGAGMGDMSDGGADQEFDDYVGDEIAEGGGGQGGDPNNANMVSPDASPSGGAQTDDVVARVNVGEFVVPKDVTSWLGEKFLQKLIEKSRMEMQGPIAEPDDAPVQAIATSPPSFMSEGARGQTPAMG